MRLKTGPIQEIFVRKTFFIALFVCVLAVPSFAQDERAWVDVNFGIAGAAEDTLSRSAEIPLFSELATFGAVYSNPRGADFDLGGGYMLTPVVGLGVSLQGTAHQDVPGLAIRIPHPLQFNAHASDVSIGTRNLTRGEGSFNIQAMIVATPNSERVRVRFFGGPTFFRVTQDTIDDILYDQAYQILGPGNVVDITDFAFSESEGTGWGFHGGADIAVFFNRVVGIGGFARMSRGTVELVDAGGVFESKAGGFQTGGGLRFKF
jgi:hypothetical protein